MMQAATKRPLTVVPSPEVRNMERLYQACTSVTSEPIGSIANYNPLGEWLDVGIELHKKYTDGGHLDVRRYMARLQKEDHQIFAALSTLASTIPPAEPETSTEEPAAEKKEHSYPLHPLSYLKNLPKRQWGVNGLLLDKGLSAFVGDGGSGKTTFKFDLDIARACGINFIGRETKPAFVIWVAGESIDELYDRAIAMLKCNNLSEDNLTNFLILDGAMPFNNVAEVNTFIEEVRAQLDERNVTPSTHSISFTFDTYARCTPGADENSTQDTKMIVDSMLKVSNAFSAQVSIIHHVNAQGRIRGNTAFRDGLDTMWIVTKDGDTINLQCDKMRGKDTPPPFQVEMRSILLDPDNPDSTAPVIFPLDGPTTGTLTPRIQIQMLDILREEGSRASNDWYRKCDKAFKIPYMTWNNHKKALEEAGFVEAPKDTPRGQKKIYTITKLGEELLG